MNQKPNPVFLFGLALLLVVALWVLMGSGPGIEIYSAVDAAKWAITSADSECTGFPEGFGQWQWGACCKVHDMGGSDGLLAQCLLDNTPVAATPLVFLALAIMAFWRPIYNLLQKLGWMK